MFLVRSGLSNPYGVIVMGIAILVLGLTVIGRIPTDLLPQFKTPAVQIVTFYPGMPAETIERDISTRIQRWTGQSVGIEHQEAKSMLGVSIVKDFFREGIDPNLAMTQVTSYAMSDLFYLPPGTVPPMVMPFDPTAAIPLCLMSVKSDIYNETKLYDIAYFQLRNRLQSIPGVIAPAVYGGKLRRILAYVDREKLQARGLSPMDVVSAIHKFNVFIPTGSARIGPLEYQIESNAMVSHASDLNEFPIKLDGRAPVLLKDIGRAQDSAELQSNIVRVDGKRQLYVPIYRQPGANTLKVVDEVRKAIPELNARLPKGVDLEVVFDQSTFVRQSIRNLVYEGLIGALFAAIMILLFLRSFRSTWIILLSLPLSILAALIGLYFTGHSVDAMTLGGLAISIGLLIDQSIVVLENTERHLEMGKEPSVAAYDATLEVAKPVFIIVVTICIVFFPVIFLTGIGKFLFTPLALAVMLAMGASYVMAMTVVPVCSARFLRREEHQEKGLFRKLAQSFEKLQEFYITTLIKVLALRWRTLAFVGVVFLGSMLLTIVIGTELFPQVDSGQFTVRVRANSGTQVNEMERILAQVEETVRGEIGPKNLRKLITNIGVLNDWPAAYTPNSGPHDAFMLIQLSGRPFGGDRGQMRKLRQVLTERYPGIEFLFEPNSMLRAALNFGLSAPINIQVQGNDLHIAYGIAEELKKRINKIQGTVDVHIQQRLDYPQYKIEMDRRKVAEVGLTPEEVVKNVVTVFNSSVSFAKSFWIDEKNGNHYWIGAQYPEKDFKDLETLLNVPITGPHQREPVLLRSLVHLKRATAPSEVMHYNINRVIDVYADVEGRDLGSVSKEVETVMGAIEKEGKLPPGYRMVSRGEVKSMKDSFGGLGFGLVLASILVYLVMVVQFRSMKDPLIVMAVVPLGFIGVLWMLFITGTYLSIQSLMGSIMMIGIVVSFSILMIDFAHRRFREGVSRKEAILEAAKIRLRPILMTSLSAMLGLVPMAIAGGANIPLARAVIGGVAASTVFTLYIVPILYTFSKKKKVKHA